MAKNRRQNRGSKRKHVDEDERKMMLKDRKHLEDFGEEHPINHKLGIEDRLAKRVFDDKIAENDGPKIVLKDEPDKESDQVVEPNYYEELLNEFHENNDVNPESEESDLEEQEDSSKINLIDSNETIKDQTKDEIDDHQDIEDENEGESDLEDSDNVVKSSEIDNFAAHFFTDFESADIEALNKSKFITKSYQWPNVGAFVECRTECDKFDKIQIDQPVKNVDQIQLKPVLKENIPKSMMKLTRNKHQNLTPFQLELLSLLTTYKNLFYPQRTFENGDQIRLCYALHSLNHVLKTRTRIVSHNSKISHNQANNKIVDKGEYRDQGLTRPKVLILLPFRDSAFKTVNTMINLLFGDCKDSGEKKINLMNYKRFKEEFGPEDDGAATVSHRKPEDYKKLFEGNIDDSFRLGISLTKKSLKLYSDFYSSDIIIASPLGLRTIIGAPGENERDYDFLSSIEMVILDQADVFLMQNWEHVLHIMSHLHLKPNEAHGVDFYRVKLWVLELWSKYYFQLIMFTSIQSTMINGFFNKYSTNYAGKILFRNEISKNQAAINNVYIQCPQIFHRFHCPTFGTSSDSRFEFFVQKILPKFRNDPMMVRTMIFVPSYFDYVRLRNYFRQEDISFTQICEYSKPGKVAKSRHIFFYGGRHFLLYTERFHFYHRYTIKGIRHLIFYEPPLYPHFYSEMVNSMNRSNQGKKMLTDYSSMSVTILFNKFDLPSLIGLVGTTTAAKLLSNDDDDVHMFLTENIIAV